MAVFPESMDKLNTDDIPGSLAKIQDYVRYMSERIEFSFRNMTRNVNAAGVSSTELYVLYQAQAQASASMQSTLNSISGNITALQETVAGHTDVLGKVSDDNAKLLAEIETIKTELAGVKTDVEALTARVDALEQPTPTE